MFGKSISEAVENFEVNEEKVSQNHKKVFQGYANEIEESLDEGHILNFADEEDLSKDVKKLMSMIEKNIGMKEKMTRDAIKLQTGLEKALILAKKIKEDDYPADTRSGGGKNNTEYTLEKAIENMDNVLGGNGLNMRMG